MLNIENISVEFDDFSLREVSLTINKGDYLALLGVSGAGKTVLLEILAGLVAPDQGRILLDGLDITQKKIQHRSIGLVYQDLMLFPHMNVFSNISYALRKQKLSSEEIKIKVQRLAKKMGVSHLLHRYPGTLSGGEAQRVALARTLAAEPKVLLLDEPLANLDVKLKSELRSLLLDIHQSGKSIIHVTHDYLEAATLSTHVAVIENGRLVQYGEPEQVFRHPATEFVARFCGTRNLFPCVIESNNNDMGVKTAVINDEVRVKLTDKVYKKNAYVMIPQDDIILSEQPIESSALNRFQGIIKEVYIAGQGIELIIDAGVDFVVSVSKRSQQKMELLPGKKTYLSFKASAVRLIV